MITVIIYAAGEYPTDILFHVEEQSFTPPKNHHEIWITGILVSFSFNEIIAVTNNVNETLWLNPAWTNAPYVINELLPAYPLTPGAA